MKITKIVITGGPCAGKSDAKVWVRRTFTQEGRVVLFIPETATELIAGGVAPWTCGSRLEYHLFQHMLQVEKERVFELAAQTMDVEEALIVCDRGALDCKAYLDQADFEKMLELLGETEEGLCARYDAVFHLVTAAKGAVEFYTVANNEARTETVAEAIALDDRLKSAWSRHPHLCVIDNATDFEKKMVRLTAAISSFLESQSA